MVTITQFPILAKKTAYRNDADEFLVMANRQHLKELDAIDKNVSCYDYLLSFKEWRTKVIAEYTRIYRYFYPLFFWGVLFRMDCRSLLKSFPIVP